MKKIILIATLLFFIPSAVSAKKIGGIFGKNERIVKLSEVEVKGGNGEDLFLAYKTTSLFFFMGVYITDDGYVLGVKGSVGSYYPLSEAKIQELQDKGYLPVPMPKYQLPLSEWLWGFSLWILLVILLFIWFFPNRKANDFNEGCSYYYGEDIPVDYQKAKIYFEKAAKKQYAPALYNLGIMHLKGQGVSHNTQKAMDYFEKAVSKGSKEAAFVLGNIYFNEEELKDFKRAISFYRDACSKGHEKACEMVSYIKKNNLVL